MCLLLLGLVCAAAANPVDTQVPNYHPKRHYVFEDIGTVLVANDYAHLAVRVNFTLVEPFIIEALNLFKHISSVDTPHADIIGQIVEEEVTDIRDEFLDLYYWVGASPTKRFDAFSNRAFWAAYSDRGTSVDTTKREKRQVLVGLAAFVSGAILREVGSVFGLFGSDDVDGLRDSLVETNNRQDHIIQAVNSAAAGIEANQQSLARVAKSVKWVLEELKKEQAEIDLVTLTACVRHVTSVARRELDKFKATFAAAAHNKLHHSMVTREELLEGLEEVKKVASVRGLTPVVDRAHQLLQLEASISLDKDGYTILVHVPLTRLNGALKLKEFKGYPLALTKKTQLMIEPKNRFLALGSDGSHVELSQESLDDCLPLGPKLLSCPKANLLRTEANPSCLKALHSGQQGIAQSICPLYARPAEPHVMAVGTNEFVAYRPEPATMAIRCVNGTRLEGQPLGTVQNITVDPNCVAYLPEYRISPISRMYINTTLDESHVWAWPLDEILSQEQMQVLPKVLDRQLTKEVEIQHLPRLTTEALTLPRRNATFPMSMASVLGVAVFALVGTFVFLRWRTSKCRQKWSACVVDTVPKPGK